MGSIRLGNAPCSWGALEFDAAAGPAGYGRVLDEMASAGYAGTELGDWGFMPTEPTRLRAELAERGLELLAGFVPVALSHADAHAAGVEVAVRTARLLAEVGGAGALVVLSDDNAAVPARRRAAGRVAPADGLGAAAWDTFAAGVGRIARAVRAETGLRTVVHHHAAGYVESPGELAELMRRVDPTLVGLCLDTGHYAFGGGDPVAALRQYGSRVWHVHFKDHDPGVRDYEDYFAAVRAGVFCELGRGAVDFAAMLAVLAELDYRGWIVVEQDVLPGMGTPLASARRNREYLAGLGL